MAASAKKEAAVGAEAHLMRTSPARASTNSIRDESYKECKSHRNRHHTANRICQNRNKKSSKSGCTVSMRDTDPGRKATCYCQEEPVDISKTDSDHSSPGACYENCM